VIKMAVGCGGNCKNGATGSCTVSNDCINFCKDPSLTVNPCGVTAGPADTCGFLNTINNQPDSQIIKTDTQSKKASSTQNGTCPYTYDPITGDFSSASKIGKKFRNWCSGANMHFDFTNDLKMPDGSLFNIYGHQGDPLKSPIVRYRRVKCPISPDHHQVCNKKCSDPTCKSGCKIKDDAPQWAKSQYDCGVCTATDKKNWQCKTAYCICDS